MSLSGRVVRRAIRGTAIAVVATHFLHCARSRPELASSAKQLGDSSVPLYLSAEDLATQREMDTPVTCADLPFPVYSTSRLLRDTVCRMIERDWAVIKGGGAKHGVTRDDAARILLAVVGHDIYRDAGGKVVEVYDRTEFAIEGKDFALAVQRKANEEPKVFQSEPLTHWMSLKARRSAPGE